MRRRRFKRRLFWATVIFGLLVLALVATIAQAVVAAGHAVGDAQRRVAASFDDARRSLVPQPDRAVGPALAAEVPVRRSARTGSP
jgi:hypothetical protein